MGVFDTLSIQAIGDRKATIEALTIPVDYNAGDAVELTEPGAWRSQIDVDAALGGASAFKYLQDVIDSLPAFVVHTVTIECAAGVHRPKAGQPSYWAWDITHKFASGLIHLIGPAPSQWTTIGALSGLVVQSHDTGSASKNPSLTFPAATFPTDGSLKGEFVELDNGYVSVIHDHDDATLYLMKYVSPAPTAGVTTGRVCRPACIFRDAFTDGDTGAAYWYAFQTNTNTPLTFGAGVKFENIVIDPWNGGTGIFHAAGLCDIEHCIFDNDTFAETLATTNSQSSMFIASGAVGYMRIVDVSFINPRNAARDRCGTIGSSSQSALYLQRCFMLGSLDGLQFSTIGGSLGLRGVVVDGMGRGGATVRPYPGFITTPKFGYCALSFYSFDNDKKNTIRNFVAQTTLPNRSCVYVEDGTWWNEYTGCDFEDNDCDLILMGPQSKIEAQSTFSLTDGGGNLRYGWHIQGPFSLIRLNANVDITGASGDLRIADVAVAYSEIEGAGQIEVDGYNLIEKEA